MKVLLLAIIFTIITLSAVSFEVSASSKGLRQGLLERSDIEALYVVDSTHTFIKGALPEPGQSGAFKVVGSYYNGPARHHVATMIEHEAEPMVYKGATASLMDLAPLRSGRVRLTSAPLGSSDESGGYSAIDIFETATITCNKRGGYPLYVVPRQYGDFKRLTEVSALTAFEYILGKGVKGVWFVACDGPAEVRFQVMKNYDLINDGEKIAELREGLVLDDVNYVKDKKAETARLAALERSWPKTFVSLEGTAREIAALKMGYVRTFNGKKNYGSYRGDLEKGRCASVSIKSVAEGDSVRVSEVHDYKVCSGKVYALGVSETEEKLAGGPGVYKRGNGFKMAKSP
ncbi:MAG: hypothetical protein ACE5DW_05000 [Thermodesulfobacteriota bacterium]